MADWNDEPQPLFGFPLLHITAEQRQAYERQQAEQAAMGNLLYSTLPIYTGDTARCVKCGGTKVRTDYLAPKAALPELGEHDGIRRTCKRCDFSWYERALDAEAAE